MKREYVRPTAVIDNFAADVFCTNSVCGTENVVYNFVCDAGEKNHKYAVLDANNNVQTISGMYLDGGVGTDWFHTTYYFHPCKETHQASSDSGFITGLHLDDISTPGDDNISVVVWTENNTDVHCTTALDMNKWTTAKS